MRIKRYVLPALAFAGVLIAALEAVNPNRPVSATNPQSSVPSAPFASFVAATGTIEAGGDGNIVVGTSEPGIVTRVFVKWGDVVHPGDALFEIDDRDLRAQLPLAVAAVQTAKAKLEQAKLQLAVADRVPDPRAISVEELDNRRSAVKISTTAVVSTEAEVRRLRLDMERRTVRALVAGRILQLNIRPGEYASAGATGTPLILLGSAARLNVRVDVDQFDAVRVHPDAHAIAALRGIPGDRVTLRFERAEPYMVAKTALSGTTAERVDTRVLPVIYSFDPSSLPAAYVGQQMDVFIEAAPASGSHPAPAVINQTQGREP